MRTFQSQIDAVNDRVTALDRYLRRTNTTDVTEPFSDRQSAGQMERQDMGRTARILYGKVVDSIAYCHWYKVQLEGGHTTVPCCMMSGTALTPFGVREHNQLHPNAAVYVILHPSSPYGVIIGVEPKSQFDPTKGLSDYISMSSRNSVKNEQVHNFPFTLPKQGTVVDWSSGRPVDATTAGEYGLFAESGVGVFLDSAMAFLRADENCGFWAFYRDQMARMSGHNLQIRATGGWELEALDDQGEFNHYSGFTPYPWEQLGAFDYEDERHTVNEAKVNQIDKPYYSAFEPKHDDQQPFHRTRHYHGYAGQGGKRAVNAGPKDQTELNRFSVDADYPGLLEENVALTGLYTLRSAKGIRLIKRSVIPVPKAKKRPEDHTGDKDENYKAASRQGSGEDHKVTGDFELTDSNEQMQKVAGLADLQAYGTNWENYIGFHYHEKDYHLPEESDLVTYVGKGVARLPFNDLKTKNFVAAPAPSQIKIDHRYGEVNYYPTVSYVDMLDDGGMAIGCGFGSEIRMTGGNIYFTCPGDIFMQPGRRLVGMAGSDTILRSRNSTDISATEKDVRIYAGQGIEVAAEQGILLESRAEGSSFTGWQDRVGEDVQSTGIMFKAAKSAVTAWSDMIYLRTGIDGSPGIGMFLDAGQGEGSIGINASSMTRWLQSSASDHFGGGEQVQNSCIWGIGGHTLGGNICVDGSISSTGSVLANDWFYSASGHVATALARQYNGLVGHLKDRSLEQARTSVDGCRTSHAFAKVVGATGYGSTWEEGLYAEGQAGNDETIEEIVFSFRNQDQYKTADFQLYESRWQQMARIWGTATNIWAESPVPKSNEDTYPFPGKEKLVDEMAYFQQDLRLADFETGVSKSRESTAYEEPELAAPVAVVLNSGYPII